MKMNLDTLEKVSSILFDALRSRGLQEIEVEDVFYRVVPWSERHSMGGERVELEVGSLFDDYSDIQRVASGQQEPLAYHLSALACLPYEIGGRMSEEV
ncbi:MULTISPECIES: hypothetical protein [Stenotrophomonas]|uniref:hypothetical protein n=1 Tax=Stenotrophomonas TaxID=40323 RepID=UPI0002BE586C|nr:MULTISPECIES: hypothetical protein [Stenotrophomonas]QCZ98776.1 hypothetical protein DL544_19940 [Stenotrophomonas sp. pho]EMI48218.1 hypothetical protein C405_17793 [Stenotrophomonas maltophilia AU12-09]MBY6282338.1 hypothetical protein [Stenotrophomonas maltophilia]MCF3468551.1 hypothetical protein [Stenotrophomonas maltophilia]MCF3492394.1 hypothetical protein [Stenotrophomonas maltophilia]